MIYLPIMRALRTFLKISILLILLAALSLAAGYSIFRDTIHEKAGASLASALSDLTGCSVDLGSVEYVPFQSIAMNRVKVSSKGGPGGFLANANNITVSVDVLSLIKDKQLKTLIYLNGLDTGSVLCNATVRTTSRKAADYKKVFDISLLDSIFIIEASISSRHLQLRDVFGTLEMDGLAVPAAKIRFKHNAVSYLLNATALKKDAPGYDISLRSDDLGLTCAIREKEKNLDILDLRGMYYTFRFDLNGQVKDFSSPDRSLSIDGTIKADPGTFHSLPGKAGTFAREHPMSGSLSSTVSIETISPETLKFRGTADILVENLKIDRMRVRQIIAKAILEEGRLNVSDIQGVIYGGILTGGFNMGVTEKNKPYIIDLALSNMDYERLMNDADGNEENVWGTFNADLVLEGYANDLSTATGSGSITITDGDLGPMPILTPLLGDMYSSAQKMLQWENEVNIDQAYMDFEIRDRKIITDDLTLLGDDIYISSEGSVDFEGNLDFTFENHFREPDTEKDPTWQTELRNVIIRFGKLISRGHLGGTLSDQKWDFKYINPFKGEE